MKKSSQNRKGNSLPCQTFSRRNVNGQTGKAHSNRRVQESHSTCDHNRNKQLFQHFNTRKGESKTPYLVNKNGYNNKTQNSSGNMPQFKHETMTSSPTTNYQQSNSGTTMLSNLVTTATGSNEPKYVSDDTSIRTTRKLDGPPQSNEDWYIATGGIIPYRKPKDDNSSEAA